jgi:hypothetical protein
MLCATPAPAVEHLVTKTYLLIDLENRQPDPELVAAWMGRDGEAWIFYGEQQISLLPNYWQLGELNRTGFRGGLLA